MLIRRERPEDVAVVDAVTRAAFGRELEPSLLVGRTVAAWTDACETGSDEALLRVASSTAARKLLDAGSARRPARGCGA